MISTLQIVTLTASAVFSIGAAWVAKVLGAKK
jgi:hypothetical protein